MAFSYFWLFDGFSLPLSNGIKTTNPNHIEPEIKKNIDSLKSVGYVVYFESVRESGDFDSLQIDTMLRKTRKIVGLNPNGGYHNKKNKSLPKSYSLRKYVPQDYDYLGVTEESGAKNVDLSLSRLIEEFEKIKGEVVLNECDFETGLYERYRCKGKIDSFHFTQSIRNEYVVDFITKSNDDKILLLYGKGHANWIASGLQENGFIIIKKGKCIYL